MCRERITMAGSTVTVGLLVLLLSACGREAVQAQAGPQDAFMERLAQHCGEAFEGRVLVDEPAQEGESPFAGQSLIMHVRECREDEILIPFHVGENRSRTWVVTRTDQGLRLKHDHRHEDGSDETITMYGGDTASEGSAIRQEFPVDQFSIDMFLRDGLDVSTTNVWAMEIEPGERFLYELARPGGRLFQVEFDLTESVELPPAPWGH